MTYSERFKAARKAAGYTQRSCAEKYGIPVRTIENWESGKNTPPDYVQRLMLAEMARRAAEKEK